MIGQTCSESGCDNLASRSLWTDKCAFHQALSNAKGLSADEFDRLRAELATAAPLTQEERRARRVRSSLRMLELSARSLKRDKRSAREAGATDGQIADAIRRGKKLV